jgi:hypothetical protein
MRCTRCCDRWQHCLASAVVLGTSKIESDWSWRLPLIFQAVPPLIVMVCEIYLRSFCLNSFLHSRFLSGPSPRTPRWNLANGRDEEAMAFLAKYHGNGSRDNPIVQLQWKQLKKNIKLDCLRQKMVGLRKVLLLTRTEE